MKKHSFNSQANTIRSPASTTAPSVFNQPTESPPSSTFSTSSSFSSFASNVNQSHSPGSLQGRSLLSIDSRSTTTTTSPQTPDTTTSCLPLPFTPNSKNTHLHQLALNLALPESKAAFQSALQLQDNQNSHQSRASVPASTASTIDINNRPSLLDACKLNSTTYSMPLPSLPSSPPTSNHHSYLRTKKCPSVGSKQSTVRTSKSKKKARPSDRLNAASFDSIPAILPKFSRPSDTNLPRSLLDSRSSPPKEPDTLATFYMVCGLPKNPQCWTLAQPDYLPSHLPDAVPRFWRPEVLGTTIAGQEIPPSSTNIETSHKVEGPSESISKDELSKIQSKAIKLAFAREVEVIASTLQPPSTTHCFSFTTHGSSGDPQDTSHQWDLCLTSSNGQAEKTYYAACLQVWSHSDRSRAEAIRKTLEEGSNAKSAAVAQAIKAAAAGRKLGFKLQKAVNSPMGFLPSSADLSGNVAPPNRLSAHSAVGSTDTEDAEGFFSESEWETGTELVSDNIAHRLLNNVKSDNSKNTPSVTTPLWLPYCLVLISKYPLYDLMVDHLKISWARYHNSIYKHSLEMLRMLNFPLPKSSSIIKFPVGSSKESSTKFVVKLPGINDLSNDALEEVNFTMWPLFKCLSMPHMISIYEVGLSPMGRIVFFSNHPPILNIAVESLKLLLELRGWVGLSQSIVHTRDFKIYLEDPGPFILGVNSQLKHIAADISPEIMVVDLDTDTIKCPKPHPDAISKGQVRMKIEKKLYTLLGSLSGPKSVPVELQEAFPGGRFRPFSAVEIKDQPSEAEQLLPPPEWNWCQNRTVVAFDDVMCKIPKKGIAKILKRKTNRQAAVLDPSALHVQEIIRKHTVRFVDRRDMLENKIWKLNRRLAFLMSESMEWKHHLDNFQKFTDMLSTESQDLKTRLENERREHRTLTGVVAEQKSRQAELEDRLLETEKAWMAAQVELAKAQEIRGELQRQKEIMVSEMKSIALGGDDETMLGEIVPRIGSFIESGRRSSMNHNRQISLTTKNLRRLSAQDRITPPSPCRLSSQLEPHEESEVETDCPLGRLSSAGGYRNFLGAAESDIETTSDDTSALGENPEDDERTLLSRSAVVETMRSIQTRLESALRTAGQLDEEELKGYEVHSPFSKSALSRMSTDSQGSKVIPLQRGRRKPQNGANFESNTPSASSSPVPNARSSGAQSASSDNPNEISHRPSNRPPGSSVVSLLLPGSSIFGDKLNLSLAASQLSSASACSTHEIVEDMESEDGDRDEDDDDGRSGDDYSCDDGASFVSANDQSENPDHRRMSTDSCFFSSPNSPDRRHHGTSRVSILCASSPTHPARKPSQPTPKSAFKNNLNKSAGGLIAFPSCPSKLEEDVCDNEEDTLLGMQKYFDGGDDDDSGGKAAITNQGEIQMKPAASLQDEDFLTGPVALPPGIHHRGSFMSNCSSITVKNLSDRHQHRGQQHAPLPRSPLLPTATPRTLHRFPRASHTTIKLSSSVTRHSTNPTEHVDFPLDNLRFKLGAIQSSRRLRSTPSPTSPFSPQHPFPFSSSSDAPFP